MKASEVLKRLDISRTSLTKYVKNGTIKVITLPSGLYDYDMESVEKFLTEKLKNSPTKDLPHYKYSKKTMELDEKIFIILCS